MSTKSRNQNSNEDLLNQRANSRGGESLSAYHKSRAYKQQPTNQYGNQFASLHSPFAPNPLYPTHFHALQQQPHLVHYSQLNAQELDLNKLNNQQMNLPSNLATPTLQSTMVPNLANLSNLPSLKPVDLNTATMAASNLQSHTNLPPSNLQGSLTPNKSLVQNPKSTTLLYGLSNLATNQPQLTNLNKMQQLNFDYRAASALESKPLKSINPDMESYSLNSYGQSLVASNQQLQQLQPHSTNLYYINSGVDLNQLNRMNQPRSLSPNRSPLYLVHQNGRSTEFDAALQSTSQTNLQSTGSKQAQPTDQTKHSTKKDENERLLNEIQQLKENLKKIEIENETLTIKLNRETLVRTEPRLDKSERTTLIDKRKDKAERSDDKIDKCVNKDARKAIELAATTSQTAPQQQLNTTAAAVDSGQELKKSSQTTVNQRPPDLLGKPLETRLNIDDEDSFEEDSERNKETII